MMQFLSNPDGMAEVQQAFTTLATAIQEIRDAVILQNRLTAISLLPNVVDSELYQWLDGIAYPPETPSVGEGST